MKKTVYGGDYGLIPDTQAYMIDASKVTGSVYKGHLKMGGTDPAGHEINVTNRYFTYDGKPWIPVMGEMHFSRCPDEFWEESIIKMKACKVNIIATYLFWIHHEEIEDCYNWTGNRNIRRFVELCAKNDLFVFLRIGPWSHGECRNGGFPDWIGSRCITRTNDPEYLQYVERYYSQISEQVKGLWYKDGGPIVGLQFDNELTNNEEHLRTLKKMALKLGMEAPIYTATGWGGDGNAKIPQDEMIPMFGGYPEAPWEQHMDEPKPSMHYCFYHTRNDAQIGGDLYKETDKGQSIDTIDINRYPYATCELGGGVQVTDHRRPMIKGDDIGAISLTKLGNGNNLPGYYMFHGGSNPIGVLTTMNESKESGYPNDLPIISYDFQAPIGEYGQINESYSRIKIMNIFLNDFGNDLAPLVSVLPERQPMTMTDNETLRFAVRTNEFSGFIFINNYQRHYDRKDLEGIQIELQLKNEVLTVPDIPITVNQGEYFILPFNYGMGKAILKYATAQMLSRIYHEGEEYLFFYAPKGLKPVYVFANDGIKEVEAVSMQVKKSDSRYHISDIKPGTGSGFKMIDEDGWKINIITLTKQQALNFYKGYAWGRERVFITQANLLFGKANVDLLGDNPDKFSFSVFPDAPEHLKGENGYAECYADGLFETYTYHMNEKQVDIKIGELQSCDREEGKEKEIENRHLKFSIEISDDTMEDFNDVFLYIDYVGDYAQARIKDTLISDDFYKGAPWIIGLKRFRKNLKGNKIIVEITPLNRNKKVYLESWPDFTEDNAVEIKSIKIVPEYKIRLL